MLGATADQSEDCLTLNIWTKPQDGEKKKPVLVWVHGGGYTSGSSAVPWYNGQYLAGKEDLVVVTLNYRLSILGFPGNPVSPANLGLLDQRLALEWVRDNIAGFGGDPERITLFGQSAGGGSVDHYSYAWKSDPIVQAFILMSGTAAGFGLPSKRTAGDNWFNTTAACGCGNATDDPDRVYECMRAKPAVDIVTNITRVTVTDPITGLPFSPTVDEKYVFSNYIGRKPIAAPVMIGNTDLETGLFRLLQPTYPAVIWPLINDIAFDCPAAMRAAQSVLDGNPTWRYRWFGDFPNLALSTSPKSGSWHASDVRLSAPFLYSSSVSRLILIS
ncbi:hypothetical protein DL546_008173 [Coniochaeta pulveracea]|uniref:Carboxylic ester hydrolase n=1 Tax=Coniochaeta pulveracea TaxID=177199 RepID=A0A420YGP0_9PEZI|nr:hypothetical protein DL546_008173 [Coniochaeta pulveracea]